MGAPGRENPRRPDWEAVQAISALEQEDDLQALRAFEADHPEIDVDHLSLIDLATVLYDDRVRRSGGPFGPHNPAPPPPYCDNSIRASCSCPRRNRHSGN